MFSFDVSSNIVPTVAGNLEAASEKAVYAMAVQAQKDTDPYVPFLSGTLSDSARVEGHFLIYGGRMAPYARYLYYGKLMIDPATGSSYASYGATKVLTDKDLVFNKAMHSQAQSHWFEASKAENKDKWERVFGKAVKRYLRG